MDFNEEDELLEEELEEQSSEGFAKEGNANPSSSEQFSDEELLNEEAPTENVNPLAQAADGVVEVEKAVAKKEILNVLLKSPWFWGAVGIIVLIFLAVLIFHMDFDLYGVGNPKPKYYQTPSCGKVFLTWENESYTKEHKDDPDYEPITDPTLVDLSDTERFTYEEYEYDDYVAGVIWTDNDKALDVDNEIVYQAMAIAARSRLISSLPNNCVILKNYNEQAKSFKKLEGNEEKYSEIMAGVRSSNGIIIGKKGSIISAKYEPFSYVKKRMEENESKYFYHMQNENEREQQVIPSEWVVDIEQQKGTKIPKVKVSDYVKLSSMSLYGAKYLLEKVDSQYDLYQILEYYYGRDIDYYTINATSNTFGGFFGTSGCMWWPVGGLITTTENGITYSKMNPYSTDISSGFGTRNAPKAGASTNHKAIDITGHNLDGTINIIAAADGVVIASNTGCVRGNDSCGGGLGNYVKIQHNDGTVTRYGHLHTVYVSNGDQVRQGQVIGLMGSTGNSTGVHLDFQVIVNGIPVNPLNYISGDNPRGQCLISMGIVTGNENTQTICLTLKSRGLSDNAVSAIMGNIQAESSFNPNAVNSIGCSGIIQWCSGRMQRLKSIYGNQWNLLDAQLNYFLYELNSGSYNSVKNYLNENNSVSDMAHYFCMHFEIPGEASCNSGVRQRYANNWYHYVQNNCSN